MRLRTESSLHKTLSFAVIHLAIAVSLGWLFTGGFILGGLLALAEPTANTIVSHGLEKLSSRWRGDSRRRAIVKSSMLGLSHFVLAVGEGYAPGDVPPTVGFWYDHIHPDDAPSIFSSLALVFTQGLNLGVDFVGGQAIRVTFTESATAPTSSSPTATNISVSLSTDSGATWPILMTCSCALAWWAFWRSAVSPAVRSSSAPNR